jgi:hypothetical protein
MNSHQNNGKVWVSDLNARPEIRSAFPRSQVRFYDTTLRDGEQTPEDGEAITLMRKAD